MQKVAVAFLLLVDFGPSAVFAKGMNPITAPHRPHCPPGYTSAGGNKCAKPVTVMKGSARR